MRNTHGKYAKALIMAAALAGSAMWCGYAPVLGGTVTWDGGDSSANKINWNSGLNWSANAIPIAGDDVVIVHQGSGDPTNQNIVGLVINSLSFGSGASQQLLI